MRKVKREVSSIVVRVSQKCSALHCEEQEKKYTRNKNLKGIVTDEPHSDSQGLHCEVSRTVELTIVTANCEKSAEAVVGRGYSSLLESIPKAVALIGDVFFHYAVLHI